MFRCAVGHFSKPREKRTLVVIEKRLRTYPPSKSGHDPKGWEIAKEVPLCPKHTKEFRKEEEALLDTKIGRASCRERV